MRFENLENNTFQLKVDEAFLEIAKSVVFDYKKLDDEGSWNDFIKQILKDVGIDDNESDYKSAGLSFEINLGKDDGFLRVLLKGQIKKEYQVSSVAFGKYKDEIEPEINKQIDLDRIAESEQKARLLGLKDVAENHPYGNSAKLYKEIMRESIDGSFSVELVEGNILRLSTYYSNGNINDVKEFSLPDDSKEDFDSYLEDLPLTDKA